MVPEEHRFLAGVEPITTSVVYWEEPPMAKRSPAGRRALIVEDEPLVAMALAADMQALGFDACDLAATAQSAFLKAMEDKPDIVLMDVNLEGGREGIEAARW